MPLNQAFLSDKQGCTYIFRDDYTQKNWKFHFTAKPIGWITAEESLNSFV